MPVRVQTEDFDVSHELARLRAGRPGVGAVASFVGTVRDLNEGRGVATMTLEHYPGMTELALQQIAAAACARWRLSAVTIFHRVGVLQPGAQVVLVATASLHRQAAFDAVQFVMDYLKTKAPFWKLERRASGDHWVEARSSDDEAAARWDLG